jgi:lysophospholipase L1-like esterase
MLNPLVRYLRKNLFINLLIFIGLNTYSQIKVACIGNSITYGYGLSSPSTQSYPSKLQDLLGNGYIVSNFGVSSRTMLKNGNKPYWIEAAYTQAKAINPDIVIIMLGTNDSKLNTNWTPYKNEFYDDYVDMINSFRTLTSQPEVYICLVPPAYKEIWEISDITIKNEVNPKIKQVAIDEGISLIDMYNYMSNKSSMFLSDGIHPNSTGASEIAYYIFQILSTPKPSITQENNMLIAPESANYQWYLFGNPIDEASGGKNQIISNLNSGTYSVGLQLNSSNSSILISNELVFEKTLSTNILQKKSKSDFSIYPVPCKNYFYLNSKNLKSKEHKLLIYNLHGALFYESENWLNNSEEKIEINNIDSGLYFYKIIDHNNNNLKSGKLIVKKDTI